MGTIKIDQAIDVRRILQQASNDQAACVFWWKDQLKIIRTRLAFEAPHPKTEIAIVLPNEEKKPSEPTDASMLVYLNHIGILTFESCFIRSEKHEWIFELPKSATLNQRRQSGRYPIPKAYEYNASILCNEKKFSGQIKDISEFGLSLEINKTLSEKDEETLTRGQVISHLEFKIQNMKIECQGLIQSTRGNTVGIKFFGLNKIDRSKVSQFILVQFAQHLPKRFDYLKKITVIGK